MNFFHSVSNCVGKLGCEGEEGGEEEGGEGEGDEGAGISESEGVGPAESRTTTGDEDRICSYACEDRMSASREVTFDSKAAIVLCTAMCCACNELNSSTADSNWLESIVGARRAG
jgi:hypothetical protein